MCRYDQWTYWLPVSSERRRAFWDCTSMKSIGVFCLLMIRRTHWANRIREPHAVMWAILLHEWPSGATRFVFNCYREHWSALALQGNSNETADFLYSKEGMSQGDPFSMFGYDIHSHILPLSRSLEAEFASCSGRATLVCQWHRSRQNFNEICRFIHKLEKIRRSFGYFQEPSKCVLVVHQHNLETVKLALPDFGCKVTTGSCYQDGFIGAEEEWCTSWMALGEDQVMGGSSNWLSGSCTQLPPNYLLWHLETHAARVMLFTASCIEYWTGVPGCWTWSTQNILANSFWRWLWQ